MKKDQHVAHVFSRFQSIRHSRSQKCSLRSDSYTLRIGASVIEL